MQVEEIFIWKKTNKKLAKILNNAIDIDISTVNKSNQKFTLQSNLDYPDFSLRSQSFHED